MPATRSSHLPSRNVLDSKIALLYNVSAGWKIYFVNQYN
jgi:hypothetical protein